MAASVVKGGLRNGYIDTSVGTFSLNALISQWAGCDILEESDYEFLEKHFPVMVDIAMVHGTIHPDFIESYCAKFIYEKHIDGLSDTAMSVLAEEELKKPLDARPVDQWGATILTNPAHREFIRQRSAQRAAAKQLALDAKVMEETRREIDRNRKLAKANVRQMKQATIARNQRTTAMDVYNLWKSDHAENFSSVAGPLIKIAYAIFVVPTLLPGAVKETRKAPMIASLLAVFATDPDDLDLDDNVVDDDVGDFADNQDVEFDEETQRFVSDE